MSPIAQHSDTLSIALIGNPNTGKSTIFNALAGVRARTGNYPGVTVEKKVATLTVDGQRLSLIDLPGTYSLAPRSPDEMVAVDVLLGRRADTPPVQAVVCIVDASNLERNLYLVSQVLELGLPTVLALNMMDVARERGIVIQIEELEKRLGVRVVPVQANRRVGIDALKKAMAQVGEMAPPQRISPFPQAFQDEVRELEEALAAKSFAERPPRFLIERLILDTSGYLQQELLHLGEGRQEGEQEIAERLKAARARLAEAGMPVPAVEAIARYGWVSETLSGVVQRPEQVTDTFTDRLDRVLTHRVWGTLIFAALMVIVFQAVFSWAGPLMDLIDGGIGSLGEWVAAHMDEGPLQSLLVDGVIAGVGGVLVFLPQIFILFFFIGLLEDCGYMARAAFLMDRLMSWVGLSGKSFIPLLSSFACAIPGVMATRVIENRRDRLTTILVAPLMSCSARLPVYTLLIAAFVPERTVAGVFGLQGLVMVSMYFLGIITAVIVAFALKKTLLKGETPPFVMELPSYKLPSLSLWPFNWLLYPLQKRRDPEAQMGPALGTVWHRMVERGWAFIYRAGTLILAVSIVVWAALYYPHNADVSHLEDQIAELETKLESTAEGTPEYEAIEQQIASIENQIAGEYQRTSYLGRIGHAIEPVVKPLGWDWRIGSAAVASFPAREVVVATLSVIFNQSSDVDVEDEEQRGQLTAAMQDATWEGTDRPLFTLPVALSIMVFFALCAQCAATLAVIKRETNSWFWPLFTFTYMTTLAYLAAFATYQIGTMFSA